MKRDEGMIRDLLLRLEESESPTGISYSIKEYGREYAEKVSHHVRLLIDEGYIEGTLGLDFSRLLRFTSRGYEFLDTIR